MFGVSSVYKPIREWDFKGIADPNNPADICNIAIDANGVVRIYRATKTTSQPVNAFAVSGAYIAAE